MNLPPMPGRPSAKGTFPGPHGYSAEDMRDYGAACYAAGIDAERERAERAEAALAELVALKRMIASLDETCVQDGLRFPVMNLTEADALRAEYGRRKPAAWAAAFALVDAADAIRAAMPPKP